MHFTTPFSNAQTTICNALRKCIELTLKNDIPIKQLLNCCEKPKSNAGEIAVHFFRFNKRFGIKPEKTTQILESEFNRIKTTQQDLNTLVNKVERQGPYLHFYLNFNIYSDKVFSTVNNQKNFFGPLAQEGDRIMIEYSQPNTHKSFHVGHTRNAALGDCLVRLYKHLGHEVIAVNYFGDEGAHVAKCLWLLRKCFSGNDFVDRLQNESKKGEILGAFYSKAVELLDFGMYTCIPVEDAIVATVKSVTESSSSPSRTLVVVETAPESQFQVVCNGKGVSEGNKVAYVPMGGKYKGNEVTEKKIGGEVSQGVILNTSEVPGADKFSGRNSRSNGVSKKKAKKKAKSPEICVLPPFFEEGEALSEIGRVSSRVLEAYESIKGGKRIAKKPIGEDWSVVDETNFSALSGVKLVKNGAEGEFWEYQESATNETISKYTAYLDKNTFPGKGTSIVSHLKTLKTEVSQVLRAMESRDGEITGLWEQTKKWSLDEFRRIYAWLDCHFDHDFYESQVSLGAKKIVHEYLEKGVLKKDAGCIGVDLSSEKLGFCMLEKSDGSGLYATKDIKLAQVKFDEFKVDRSYYVVDVSQSHHFKQVFAVLNRMGYDKVKNCKHIAYALVKLPSGKMSSRKGTVIVFSELVELLKENIRKRCFPESKTSDSYWTPELIEEALHVISVGTIKYGMLSQDASRDITFNLAEWTNPQGNTGSYLMYQFTRISSILRAIPTEEQSANSPADLSLLQHPLDRYLLAQCLRYWDVVIASAEKNNPLLLTAFLYDLCKSFSSWYNLPEKKIKDITDAQVRHAHISLVKFLRECIRSGLYLLGVGVLTRM